MNHLIYIIIFISALITLPAWAAPWAYQFDNDAFIALTGKTRTDRWVTGVQRLRIRVADDPPLTMPWYEQNNAQYTLNLLIEHHLFTPENLTTASVIVEDRPYAGWAQAGLEWHGLELRNLDRYSGTMFGLNLGVIGPASQAEEIQVWLHKNITGPLFESEDPKGWDNQIENEFAVFALARQQETWVHRVPAADTDFTLAPTAALGTVMNYVQLNSHMRYSLMGNLPPIQPYSPTGPGWETSQPASKWNAYLFAGASGRYVFQNAFIEGNRTQAIHGVELEHWVGKTGFALKGTAPFR